MSVILTFGALSGNMWQNGGQKKTLSPYICRQCSALMCRPIRPIKATAVLIIANGITSYLLLSLRRMSLLLLLLLKIFVSSVSLFSSQFPIPLRPLVLLMPFHNHLS